MSYTSTVPAPGDTLPNGAIVIAAHLDRDHDRLVILAVANAGTRYAEYVTWLARPDDLRTTCHGRYTDNLTRAVNDYDNR